MKIAIEDKEISQTATNIGVYITPIDENTSIVRWSLNDENEASIIMGEETFDSAPNSEIIDALFTKLSITKKPIIQDATTNTEPGA